MKKLLFNPFEDYSEKQLVFFGLLLTIAGSLLGMVFNGRFDGMLDLHFVNDSGYQPFLDNLIAILSSTLVFFIAARFINNRTRLIDILTASLISRAPIYILTVFNANNLMNDITEKLMLSVTPEDIDAISTQDIMILSAFSFLGILFLIWFFILLWNGFKTASNAKGTRHILLFILAIVVGEVISKIIFNFI